MLFPTQMSYQPHTYGKQINSQLHYSHISTKRRTEVGKLAKKEKKIGKKIGELKFPKKKLGKLGKNKKFG